MRSETMLEEVLITQKARNRHLGTPVGPYLDGFIGYLIDQGYSPVSILTKLRIATDFGKYLIAHAIDNLSEISDVDNDLFVEWYCASSRRYGPKRSSHIGSESLHQLLKGSLRKLFTFMRKVGAIPKIPVEQVRVPHGDVLNEYAHFLKEHRGFAVRTVEIHCRWAKALFLKLGEAKPEVSLARVGSDEIEKAFISLSEGLGRRTHQIMTSALEAFLRYLRSAGIVPMPCRPFLPRLRTYALAALPHTIPWDDVERTLESIDRDTHMGKRDYAVVMLLAIYGLRASEVAGLCLDDLDWRSKVLRVSQNKTRRAIKLPIIPRVAEALIDYLRNGRPTIQAREVFIKCHAPIKPITRQVVYTIVRKSLLCAGVDTKHYGPHMLRHSRATSLIRQGYSLKVVGDLLGHRVPEATLVYCKLAIDDLRDVALEVPEVPS